MNSHIVRLERDHRTLTNSAEIDTNNNRRWNANFLASEITHLENKRARNRKNELSAKLANHGEKMGGIWSALNKEKKPRDLIPCLKVPNVTPPQYERDSRRMAELARKYHDELQDKDPRDIDQSEHTIRTDLVLEEIPENQRIIDPDQTRLNWVLTETQVETALRLSKNGSATGMDGCPYELWKTLHRHHEEAELKGEPSFNINKVITDLLTDIQTFGVDEKTNFAIGWMCPIYKKKDPTEISNYRPITLLNTDYKLLTKALAIQLTDHIRTLIHKDQAGFIPGRQIFDHIRLAKAIINHAEMTAENGAIVALDQEKAYDRINHDYLWKTLQAFNLPEPFIRTIRELYLNATTVVAINGSISKPYKIRRGIRQGDPLSCPIFDLAIEPLACMMRADGNLKGITIPGLPNPIKANFFADDTSLYLGKEDSFNYAQEMLQDWCIISGAKFNIEKTEIIPIGTETHRRQVVSTRKINQRDTDTLPDRIKIAEDGDAIRFLGAWIGNKVNDITPWEPVLDNINKRLKRWGKTHPTMMGRKTIVQAVVGGLTQFLTKAQGMPTHIEDTLIKTIRNFMWEDDSSPRIALDLLQRPPEEGGLGLLDIKARNEAIEITWLKAYLDFSPTRPTWATVTDMIIVAAGPPGTSQKARINPHLQAWQAPTRGKRASYLNNDILRMIKVSKRNRTNLAAIRLAPHLSAQLPAWYHINAQPRPLTNAASKCLLYRHKAARVTDLMNISARIRNQNPDSPHSPTHLCDCEDCSRDKADGCKDPNACAEEAQARLRLIAPKMNPLLPRGNHGNLSLTKRRKARNEAAKLTQGGILFDPSITSKDNLAECFRIFTDPNRIANIPAERLEPYGTNLRLREITAYTDGACINNGKANARCGSGVWFGPNDRRNRAVRVPRAQQSNQIGELVAVIVAVESVPDCTPLKIVTDSRYVIEGLTTHLRTWEDNGWIGVKNNTIFKRAAYLLKRRTATTSFQWIKGHNGDLGNEESDRLAKAGAEKETPDILDMEIPMEFDLQGAKLATLSQAKAYRGIQRRKPPPKERHRMRRNLNCARDALQDFTGNLETDETIWRGLKRPAIRPKVQQFLYKMMYSTQKTGEFWGDVPDNEDRQFCKTCRVTETMEHILLHCNEQAVSMIWYLAKELWPHNNPPWPNISFGLILGCGSITPPSRSPPREGTNDNDRRNISLTRGTVRLLQILITEAAHLIWAIRCERVITEKIHNANEIRSRWYRVINKRLTDDKILATKIKRDKANKQMVRATWEATLLKERDLPNRWMANSEVLVGSGA